jgi:hypothetical protein
MSLNIHFSINALKLGLVNFLTSRNWIKWCITKKILIKINVIMYIITSNHLLYFVNFVTSIINDLCCIHHTSVPRCIFSIINSCKFLGNVLNFSLKSLCSSNSNAFLGVYK